MKKAIGLLLTLLVGFGVWASDSEEGAPQEAGEPVRHVIQSYSGVCRRTTVGISYEAEVPSQVIVQDRNDKDLVGQLTVGNVKYLGRYHGMWRLFGKTPNEYVLERQVPVAPGYPDRETVSIEFKNDSEIKVQYRSGNFDSFFADVKVWGECHLLLEYPTPAKKSEEQSQKPMDYQTAREAQSRTRE